MNMHMLHATAEKMWSPTTEWAQLFLYAGQRPQDFFYCNTEIFLYVATLVKPDVQHL